MAAESFLDIDDLAREEDYLSHEEDVDDTKNKLNLNEEK